MSGDPPSLSRQRVWMRLGALYAACVVAWVGFDHLLSGLLGCVQRLFANPRGSWALDLADRTVEWTIECTFLVGAGLVVAVPLLAVGGAIVRAFARARAREGRADPLQRLRDSAGRHPRLAGLVPAAPNVAFVLWMAGKLVTHVDQWKGYSNPWTFVLAALVGAAGATVPLSLLARAGLRRLLAPVALEAAPAKDAGEIWFSAVAVTRRTRGVVAGVAGLSIAGVVALLCLPYHTFHEDPRVLGAVTAYVVALAAAIQVFRRVSRIAVGLDGIYVHHGTSTRFFAYRDLDDVRGRGADLELVRGDRVTLRLQLHGPDETRRDELCERIRAAIRRARASDSLGAEQVVQAASSHRVATAAAGGGDYRSPSVSREQLWSVVEGASADTATRAAAAEALALAMPDAERPRLRAAAQRSVEPRLRVELDALAGDDVESDLGTPAMARTLRR